MLWQEFPALQLVRTGRVVRLLGRCVFVMLLLSVIGMIFVPWQQTARGTGRVIALDPQQRQQTIQSSYDGIIKFVKPGLREGSEVREGDLIVELEPFAAQAVEQLEGQMAQAKIKRLQQEAILKLTNENVNFQVTSGQQMLEALESQVAAASEKHQQQLSEVEVLKAEYDQKQYELDQAKKLFPRGIISEQELVTKRNDWTSAVNKLEKGEAATQEAYFALQAKEKELLSKQQDIFIKNREASGKAQEENKKMTEIEKELLDLEGKRGELNRLKIVAPRNGYLHELVGLENVDTVKKGDDLFTVIPDAEELAVELKISGNDMPLVHEGDRVRLQFEGWPAVQFVGWPSVAVGTFGGKVNRISPTDDGAGNFIVLVIPDQHFPAESLWPDNRYLRQGVRANGWILLKQVALGYEIWRQLNGFPPVIADKPPTKKDDKVKVPKP